MEGGKPLIFIKPYSKTLEKLVEVLKESSEDQGTEIYEIEDVKEAIQIIPQLGQSLIIGAHPRKTAQILQAAGKLIRKIQSKVLLLTPKPIPRKTIDKFMKVGLTECIIEPIAPKTLQYKVNLLLRSIVIKKEEGNYEQNFDSNNDQLSDDKLVRKQLSANINEEDKNEEVEGSDIYATDEKDEKKKSTYKEESIAGYYKGASKKQHESIDEDKDDDADKNNSDVIEGYYKNKVAKRDDELEEEIEKKPKKQELDSDDFEELSKSASLLLEDDETEEEDQAINEEVKKEKRKSPTSLELEEEAKKKEIKPKKENIEEMDDIASHHLDLINDLEDESNDVAPEHAKEVQARKTATTLDLEDEQSEEEDDEVPNLESQSRAKKEKVKIDLEDEEFEDDQEQVSQEEKLKEKAKNSKKLNLEEDEELHEELEDIADQLDALNVSKKTTLELEEDEKELAEEKVKTAKEKEDKKKAAKLDIEDDKKSSEEKEESQEEESIYAKKKTKKLDLETEDDLNYGRKKREEKQKHQVEREIQDREENKRKAERENQGYTEREMNNKSSGYTENIQDQGGNKADVHADKLKTHYDSRTGLKHNDEEWREVERERRAEEEYKAEKKNEFAMPEKTDWGEQTIDYSNLKKQFEETSYSLASKKEVGQFEDGENSKTGIKYTQAIGATTSNKEEALEEIAEEAQEEEENPIYEADLKSSLTLIKSLNMYYQYSKNRDDTIKAILEMIRNDFGVLAAIKYGKGPKDGKLKLETIGNWLDEASKDSIINTYTDAASCPILPSYSDKTFEQKRTMFFYPFTEGITTFAWVQCFLPNGIKEAELKGLEASLETMRGALLDEFYELGGTGPYAEIKKKTKENERSSSPAAKIGSFFGGLFGKKKAG